MEMISLEQLTEVENKLTNIKRLLQEVISLSTKLQEMQQTKILFSLRPINEESKLTPVADVPTKPAKNAKYREIPLEKVLEEAEIGDYVDNKKTVITPEMIDFIRKNYYNMSIKEISEHLKIGISTIYKIKKRESIKR